MPACVRMVLSVELLSVRWLGIVSGVEVLSAFIRVTAMWLPSRTRRKPSAYNALITFRVGASTGNLAIRPGLLPLQ